ncbi:hypothetical protein EST38_g4903 [Candolleomyces aberdarensis]|uniref:C2H2-type domain-containing protein n=1 Tax=Candolleomyces aberdarensis TaxID=2316362 RepID=A0A4Q2DNM2_9AGAR|nr:hypothetical protein EST38_g4903 [Candolleomyces aberdarensis]
MGWCNNRRFWSEVALQAHTKAKHPKYYARTTAKLSQPRVTIAAPQAAAETYIPEPVSCKFCDREFGSPSAYAHHLESGVHGISRHQVTQAVQMLGIVPQITVSPSIGFATTSLLSGVDDILEGPHAQPGTEHDIRDHGHAASPEPGATSVGESEVVPGPPIGQAELEASVVAIAPPSTLNLSLLNAKPLVVYLPDNFIHLSTPYTCPMCPDTFRTVASLTAHMNSPVHDPKEFLCPKCARQFVLVSALIQHLESGCCGLASRKEVFERFGQVTAGVSRFLIV